MSKLPAMRLERVRFGAFKSLYDVTCDFDDLIAVTGPNNAGKSNFAEGIAFISDTYHYGLEFAVSRAGGYDSIAHRRTGRARTPVSVSLRASIRLTEVGPTTGQTLSKYLRKHGIKDQVLTFVHTFSLRAEGQSLTSAFRVDQDELEISVGDNPMLHIERMSEETFAVVIGDMFQEMAHDQSLPGTRNPFYPWSSQDFMRYGGAQAAIGSDLIINFMPRIGLVNKISRLLSNVKIFQLSPNQCRQSGVPTPNASLSRYGENLPAAADYLIRYEPESWARIFEAMATVIPNLAAIEVVHTEDRRLALQFREAGVRRPWNSNEISDGSIQTLALFIAIFDSRAITLLVEEPENSLHPWILRHFLDLCRASGKQIILTTHSPVLMNYLDPSHLRFMWQRKGRSCWASLADLGPELVDLWKSGEVSTFDGYDQGLFPLVVPEYFVSGGDSE